MFDFILFFTVIFSVLSIIFFLFSFCASFLFHEIRDNFLSNEIISFSWIITGFLIAISYCFFLLLDKPLNLL